MLAVNPFSTGTGWTMYKVYGGNSESRMERVNAAVP